MANITVSASNNFDASANLALNNGETITINTGAVLTMNSDNRWSQNAAVPLNITIDAASGGELLMDGRDVWWLPYTSGSGTVPVLGTTFPASNVTSATASGEFLGVFTGLGVAPSSGTMPATGFIKLRAKTGSFANAQALSLPGGATATASGAGQRGWLNIVGAETGSITIPRLGKWTARGDWFDLATTSGSRDQTIQHFVADVCPALWIETSAGSGVYEIWLNAGNRWSATYVSMDERGKFFGCTAAGVITLAATGFGKLPAAGCKIRVPNIHISSTTSANYALNTVNLTITSRWETVTTASGAVDLLNMTGAGLYLNIGNPYQVNLKNVAVLHSIQIYNNALPLSLEGVAVGIHSTLTGVYAYNFTLGSTSGGVMMDCHGVTYNGVTPVRGVSFVDLHIDGGRYITFNRTGASQSVIAAESSSVNWVVDGVMAIGDKIKFQSASSNYLIKNLQFSDWTTGGVTSLTSSNAIEISAANDGLIDGLTIMQDGVPPRATLVNILTSDSVKVRNVGTFGLPIDLMSHTGYAVSVTTSTNIKLQRVFVLNSRLSPVFSANTSDNVTQESVMGDSSGDLLNVVAGNSVIKGGFGGGSGFGTSGVPTLITSTFGTHFYDTYISTTQGLIGIVFNEPTALSGSSVEIGGLSVFDATGKALLKTAGDQLTYTWPHFILGYTGLENVAPALSGTNTGNLTIEYDLDKGSGFSGTWQTCDATNLSAEIGISATTGFKPKFRFTCATASISNSINGFYITGTTDSVSQQTQYPLDVSTLTLTGLPVAAEVRCYTGAKDGSAVEIGGVEATGGTTFTFTHSSGGSSGFIHIIHPSYKIKEIDYTYAVADTELLIQMDPDPWYSNPV